jgi:hypothetical protein
MKLHRKGLLATIGAAAAGLTLTGGLIAASAASAATAGHRAMTARGSAAIFNTLSAGHEDTTSASGSATFQAADGNGPVWAIDTLKEHWVVTSCAASPTCTRDHDGAHFAVTLTVQKGSKVAEFADPGAGTTENGVTGAPDPCPGAGANAGGAHTGQGNVLGTIEYDIQSSSAPDLSGVPAVQAPNTSLGTVIGQIFDGHQTIAGGGHYSFTYSKVCGAVYGQAG